MATAKAPARRIRTFPGFHLRFPITEVQLWADKFSQFDDDTAVLDAGKNICAGEYGLENLLVIVDWKSKRRAKLLADNSHSEREEALRIAVSAFEPRTAFGVLMGLAGIDTPMASAILTTIDPSRYTIIDWRALDALGRPDWSASLKLYLRYYFPECARIAAAAGVSLRTVDKALWSWSKVNS
jgi:hypothetical protein